MKTEIQQRVHILVNDKNHIAAPAAITTRRPTFRHKLLPAESRLPMPAIARFNNYTGSIYKLHISSTSKP
jgi:hypothetical protein